MERRVTPAERAEFLRQAKPLLDAIYGSMAMLGQALNAFVDQMLKDPEMRAVLREYPEFKHSFNGA